MKTFKKISKVILVSIIFITSINASYAQERKESFEKTFKISSTGDFTFSCNDTDLKVKTWKKDEVKLIGEIIIEGGKKEEQDKLIKLFKKPETKQTENSLEIETSFTSITIIILNLRKTILVNGKKIKVKNFKANYTLWIPESINFNLKSKYNNIDIANLTGKANLDIYDCDLKAVEMNKAQISSKYSKLDVQAINTLVLNSYDDKIKIKKINSLTSEAKYSDYSINSNLKKAILNLYDSKINAKNIDQLNFTGKYASLYAGDIQLVSIKSLYDSKIELAKVAEFNCDKSTYDKIEIASITRSLNMPKTNSSKITILNLKSGFNSFTGNFKYGSVHMKPNPALDFSLNFKTTYGKVDFRII